MLKFWKRTYGMVSKTLPSPKPDDLPVSKIAHESSVARACRLDTVGHQRRLRQSHEDNRLL